MCKYVVLQYTQCNCRERDGNGGDGDGFLVTKRVYNRLPLDHDTVPFERCTQAKCFELSHRQSHTVEFPRCKAVQVRTIRVAGEVCFACLMHRRSMDRAARCRALEAEYRELQEKIRVALGEHHSFHTRYTGAIRAATLRAAPTRSIWQSVRESPQLDEKAKDKRGHFVEKILSSLNKAQVPQEPAQTERVASVPPVYEELETSSPVTQGPPQKLRLGRKKTTGTGAVSDSISTSWKGVQQEDNIEALGESSSSTIAFSTLPRATKPIPRYSDPGLTVAPNLEANAPSSPRLHSTLSARAPEFKPFVQPPPTEPRMMRAPAAPRALRETQTVLEFGYDSFPQTTWYPWHPEGVNNEYAPGPEWQQ